jgi:hypothetical protein
MNTIIKTHGLVLNKKHDFIKNVVLTKIAKSFARMMMTHVCLIKTIMKDEPID